MSPLAVIVCMRALRSAAQLDDELAVFAQDFRVTVRFLDTSDLATGIRSAIITKHRTPVWEPARLADITTSSVATSRRWATASSRGSDNDGARMMSDRVRRYHRCAGAAGAG